VCGAGCSFDPRGLAGEGGKRDGAPDGRAAAIDADPAAPDADSTTVDAAPSAVDADSNRFPVRTNVFGPALTGTDYPGQWQADPGSGGVCAPNQYVNASGVTGTVDDALFQAVIWGNPMTCSVPLGAQPAGAFEVRLYFGEIFFGAGCPGGSGVGSRVFDVALEGTTVLSGFDVFSEGGCVADTADVAGQPVVKSFMLTISDGALDISMAATTNEAFVSAIEILPR